MSQNIIYYLGAGASQTTTLNTLTEVEFQPTSLQSNSIEAELTGTKEESNSSTADLSEDYKIARLLREASENKYREIIDKNARLALTSNSKNIEDYDTFRRWLSERLLQVMLERTNRLILGRNWGQFKNGVIQLYDKAEQGTGFHEAFEAVWNSYLTDSEQQALGKEFRAKEGSFTNPYSKETKSYSEATNYDIREMLADGFKDYIIQDKAVPIDGAPIRNTIFRRLLDFIKRIFGIRTGEDSVFSKIEDTYRKIDSGSFINMEVIRDTTQPEFRAIPGTSVDFTKNMMDGMGAIFFSKLYTDQQNIEALFSKGDNSKLFADTYAATKQLVYQYFNGQRNAFIKAMQTNKVPENRIKLEITKFINADPYYRLKQDMLNRFDGDVYTEFQKFLGQYGLKFKADEESNIVSGESEDDIDDLIEGKEANTVDALGIRDSIYIDPRNMTKASIRLLVASLTADEYKPNSNQMQVRKNALGLPTLSDYGRKLNILLNELNGMVPVYNNGQRVEAIDRMFSKLSDRFSEDGKYKPGFEWIQKLRNRLKYDVPIENLTEDQIRLLIGFESSFSNNKNLPVKLIVGDNGTIYSTDPVVVTNIAKTKEAWQSNLKAHLRELKPNEDPINAPIAYIDNKGRVAFNMKSENFRSILYATVPLTELEALRKLGIQFTRPDMDLIYDHEAIKVIEDSYSGITYAFKQGLINTYDDLFGKQVVNGPMNALLAIELNNTSEDNALSYQNAEGRQQYPITLPSALSNIVNSLKGVTNLKDFVLTNPQYGYIGEDGSIVLNPYLENSYILKKSGLIFDKDGNKMKDNKGNYKNINYEYILGIAQLDDNNGDSTDALKYPDKIVQELYHILRGTYFTIINSDKSSEFGLNMGHFLTYQQTQAGIEGNQAILTAYKNALQDEIKAAVDERLNPHHIQYYSNGVTKLGHFRDILGFVDKGEISTLQDRFNTQVLTGKESPEEFVNRTQVESLITRYLTDYIERQGNFLVNNGLVDKIGDEYYSNSFSKEQLDKLGIKDQQHMSVSDYNDLVRFIELNRQLAVFEQHKLFYGHPAAYKDLAKRSNGINSQKEAMTENKNYLLWLDKNKPRIDGKIRANKEYSTFTFVSYDEPSMVSRVNLDIAQGLYDSMIKDNPKDITDKLLGVKSDDNGKVSEVIGGKSTFIDAYINANESDGGAYIMPDFFRDLMFLSGKFSKDQDRLMNWEIANEIVDRSNPKSPYYKDYKDPTIINNARQTLLEGKPRGVILQHLKPQGFGYQTTKGVVHTTFLKHSVFPLTWSRVKDNPAMRDMYIHYQNLQTDMIGFASGEKVGNVSPNDGLMSIYDDQGKFNKNLAIPIQEMYTKYYGIQVEMAAKIHDKVVFGTQMRKLILSNLPEGLKELAQKYNDTIEQIMKMDYETLLKQIGLVKNTDGSYSTNDVDYLVNTLRTEAISRDVPDNIVDMIASVQTEAGSRLAYKFDANPTREKIDNILNSIVDSRVISQKMNGTAAVQIPATLWEQSPRSYTILREGKWVNAADANDITPEEQKTMRLMASDLHFYTPKEPWMEVYVPWQFKTDPAKAGFELKNGYWVPKEGETVENLLRLIGFRIPTQGMNSIENIRIKGFLDSSLGDVIIVPTEIVGKSGSGFDIDKMNLFVPNHYIKNGKIVFIDPSKSDSELEKEASDLYDSRLKDKAAEDFVTSIFGKNEDKDAFINEFKKQALQNSLTQMMSTIMEHPDNYRQLVMPNGSSTLEGLAQHIRNIKEQGKEVSSLTKLSEHDTMAQVRERYISGKKLVGIGAVNITSHTISQLGNVVLTGTYKIGTKEVPITIKFNHNTNSQGQLTLNSIKDAKGQYITELLSEALTGFVDAAKNPFVFDLNLNTQTAGTWFYLQKLGVPVNEIAYLHTQPLVEKYFAEQAKNESYVNKANKDELDKELVIFKAADPYIQKAFGVSLYSLGYSSTGYLTKDQRAVYFKNRKAVLGYINDYRSHIDKYSASELENNIRTQNKEDYKLTPDDAIKQLSILYDYLDYQDQARKLTNFTNAISYDTAKTKNIIEGEIQKSNLQQAFNDEFITKDSIQRVFNNTFLGEVKNQKEQIPLMFKDYFVVLNDKSTASFNKVINEINNPQLNMSNDKKTEILNRFQNFFITYLFHTIKTNVNGQTVSLNSMYSLFKGPDSLAHQLKDLRSDPQYKNNIALRQLFPLINNDRNLTDNIKLFNNKMSTYEINTISEALSALNAEAKTKGDPKLLNFMNNLGIFSILQSGVQMSPITFTKILPIDMYADRVGDILDRFVNEDSQLDPDLIWKQFHQNNANNSQIVPKIKRPKFDNGLLVINSDKKYKLAQYDYLATKELKDIYKGKINKAREKLVKQKKWNELYVKGLYEKIKVIDEQNVDITNQQLIIYYRPIGTLGNGMYLTEV